MGQLILIADDEDTFRSTLATVLREEGYETLEAADGESAVALLKDAPPDIAICDIRMPGCDGIQLLQKIKELSPSTDVIMVTAYGTVETAVEAMRLGAYDYLTKPFMFDDVIIRLRHLLTHRRLASENLVLKRQLLAGETEGHGLVGSSQGIRETLRLIDAVAATRSNVLIVGESGTGKELVARAIHGRSPEHDKPFIPINCGAIPEALIESQLFGYIRGAFTGANSDMMGLLEAATGGTIFLDEVSAMPLSLQARLLRVCDRKETMPLGSKRPRTVDVRLLAASNRDLTEEITAGRFREDLYYRLNVVRIQMPPLRDRKSDIPELVQHFIAKLNAKLRRTCKAIDPEALRGLMRYDWKGNVRELENVLERAVILSQGEVLSSSDFPEVFEPVEGAVPSVDDLRSATRRFERDHIIRVLRSSKGSREIAATILGIGLSSLYRKIDELGIQPDDTK